MARDAESFIKPYVVRGGRRFQAEEARPGRHALGEEEEGRQNAPRRGHPEAGRPAGEAVCPGPMGILLVFQAMDAAGKDGAIKHVMSGINPQGCQVFSFKAPSPKTSITTISGAPRSRCPNAGGSGSSTGPTMKKCSSCACTRSSSRGRSCRAKLVTKKIWKERYEDINAFERYLARNGYVIRKFFLNVSRAEQRRRFLERLTLDDKNWKFSMADAKEREYWDDYMSAYDDMIRTRPPSTRRGSSFLPTTSRSPESSSVRQ